MFGDFGANPANPAGFTEWYAGGALFGGGRPDYMGVAIGTESTLSNPPVGVFDFFRQDWTPDFSSSDN